MSNEKQYRLYFLHAASLILFVAYPTGLKHFHNVITVIAILPLSLGNATKHGHLSTVAFESETDCPLFLKGLCADNLTNSDMEDTSQTLWCSLFDFWRENISSYS